MRNYAPTTFVFTYKRDTQPVHMGKCGLSFDGATAIMPSWATIKVNYIAHVRLVG